MFKAYKKARTHFIENPSALVEAEKYLHDIIMGTLSESLDEFKADYDEASFLNPFWQNYPPEERGRAPRGDQFPWIEVGEHSVGFKLARLIAKKFTIREVGLPSGTDQRFLLGAPPLRKICQIAEHAMLFVDVKSVGPRDDADHTVLSTNQVSGDGEWKAASTGVVNTPMQANGDRKSHPFHCTLPPVYVLHDGTVAPTVSVFIKPVYAMASLSPVLGGSRKTGQPLSRITVVTLPNGLLLTKNPNYLGEYPALFFPGKDDKTTPPERLRARVSFAVLRAIAPWRVESIRIS